MLAVTELITDGTRAFDATVQPVVYTLLPFSQTPNKEIRAQKIDVGANTVTIQTDPTVVPRDFFAGGGFSIVLTDNTANYFTFIKKPGISGLPAIILAGVGSTGGVSGPAPSAPNVVSATAAASYGLYGNASAYRWSGSITLPTSDPNYSHLKKIHVQWTHAGGTPVPLTTLNGPWSSSPQAWTSGVNFDFLQDANTYASDSIQFSVENDDGVITAAPVSVAVTVEAAAVTSISSASEIGPQVVTINNQSSRLVSTTLSFVPVLGSNQVPQNVTFLVSQDNGVTFVYTGWSLISSVGQAITVTKISPVAAASWKVAACIGAVGGDPTIFMPAASLAAAFPGVQISASFTVAGLALPLATAVTSALVGGVYATSTTSLTVGTGTQSLTTSVALGLAPGTPVEIYQTSFPTTAYMLGTVTSCTGTALVVNVTTAVGSGSATTWTVIAGCTNVIRNDGTQYGVIGACTYTDPTDLSFFVRVTTQAYNSAMVAIAAEAPFSGFDVAGAGGTVRTTLPLNITYVAGLAFIVYRIYLSSRASQNTNDFQNPLLAQLQTPWPVAANQFAVAVAPPAAYGPGSGLGVSPTTGLPVAQTRPESILLDYSFELTPQGAVTAATVSAWTFVNPTSGPITIENDGTAYSGAQYIRIGGGSSVGATQNVPVRAGESLYFSLYSRSSGASSGGNAYIEWYTSSGAAISGGAYITFSGFVSAWALKEAQVVVPATAATATIYLIGGSTGGATIDFDSVRVMPAVRAGNLLTSGAIGDDGSGNTTAKTGPGLQTVSNALVPNVGGGTLAVNGSGQVIVTNMPAVGFLPSLPSVTYPAGAVIVVTAAATDPSTLLATPANTVYRNATGSQWAASHTPTDMVAGAVASGVTLAAAQITAGTLIAGVAYIGAIAASQITGGTITATVSMTSPILTITSGGTTINLDSANQIKVSKSGFVVQLGTGLSSSFSSIDGAVLSSASGTSILALQGAGIYIGGSSGFSGPYASYGSNGLGIVNGGSTMGISLSTISFNGSQVLTTRVPTTPATLADVIAVLQHHGLSN